MQSREGLRLAEAVGAGGFEGPIEVAEGPAVIRHNFAAQGVEGDGGGGDGGDFLDSWINGLLDCWIGRNSFRVGGFFGASAQGNLALLRRAFGGRATLGWRTQSLWD